jgi:hypothetical protein
VGALGGHDQPGPGHGDPIPNPLASTFCLFSDLRFGDSQPVYLANLLWVDDLLADSEIIALGGPERRRHPADRAAEAATTRTSPSRSVSSISGDIGGPSCRRSRAKTRSPTSPRRRRF